MALSPKGHKSFGGGRSSGKKSRITAEQRKDKPKMKPRKKRKKL